MKYILLFLFFSISFFTHAQETFEKRYWSIYAYPAGMAVTGDSSILVVANDSFYNRIFYIVKTDKNGVFQWMKTDSSNNGANYFMHNNFTSFLFIPARDDKFMIACSKQDASLNQTVSLVKIDTAGNTLWNKTYSRPQRLNSICQAGDGGFVIAGNYPDTEVSSVHYSNWITKVDSAGDILWSKVFPYGEMAIVQTDDGGYLMEGFSTITKLDADGNVLRAFQFTNRNFGNGHKVQKAVRINSNAYAFADYDYLTCYDSTGNYLWDRVISLGWWYTNKSIIDIDRLNDSTIVLLGDVLGIWPDAYVLKINTSGNLVERIEYELNNKVSPYSVLTLTGGRLLLACTTDPDQMQVNSLLLIKTDSLGYTGCGDSPFATQDSLRIDTLISVAQTFIPGNIYVVSDSVVSHVSYLADEDTICYQVTSTPERPVETFQFSISPNPCNGSFTIKGIVSNDKLLLRIFNLLGESMYTNNFFGRNEYYINSYVAKGIYFVKVSDGERNVVRKLIVE